MTFLIIILTLAVAASALFLLFWARTSTATRWDHQLYPREPVSLFEAPPPEDEPIPDQQRESLIERARQGELTTLSEASRHGDDLYEEVLDVLAESRSKEQEFAELTEYISQTNGLRSSRRVARLAIERWNASPTVSSTARMLHIAALSDDAETYHRAVDAVRDVWNADKLRISANDLKQLVESQFWVLSPEARRSGAGFQLKRRLAGFRRELAAATAAR
ncbi:MAG TPA: hypothetical protein VKM94_02540 [Blastocatellia bacterium]|nr:hypothetical protein [Blastocatellia bacterium]